MIRRATASFLTFFLAIVPMIVRTDPAEPAVEDMLRKAYDREDLITVRGVKDTIVSLPDGTAKVRVELWQKQGKRLQEYVAGPTQGDRVLEINGDAYYISRKMKVVVEAPPPKPPKSVLDLMFENYIVEISGEDNIAGRPCKIVQIKPKYEGNPSQKLWIDEETLLPLRKEYYNSAGEIDSVSVFVEVIYNVQIDDDIFKIPQGWRLIKRPPFKEVEDVNEASKELGFTPIMLEYLPEGYVFVGMMLNTRPPEPGVQIRYTDGLNKLSLFERKKRDEKPPMFRWMERRGMMHEGRRPSGRRMGPDRPGREAPMMFDHMGMHAGKAVIIPHPELHIMLIGDLSEERIREIVEKNFGPFDTPK